MESSFKMLVHHNSDNIHIKLMGDLDSNAAHLLLNSINRYHEKFHKIFVHTTELKAVQPACREILQQELGASVDTLTSLFFTGDQAVRVAPYEWQVLS